MSKILEKRENKMSKKIIILLLFFLLSSFTLVQAGELKVIEKDDGSVVIKEQYKKQNSNEIKGELTYKKAKRKVKNLRYSNQKTVEEHIQEKVSVPAVKDFGWTSFPLENGGFEIEKHILVGEELDVIYRWRVSPNGKVKPINGHAISVTNKNN